MGSKMTNLDEFSFLDTPQLDAFGRLRVSDPETIFDSKMIFDKQPLFWDESEVSGSGTSGVYNQDKARLRMSVTASTAGKRVRQTFMRFNYEPGKSQLVYMTGRITSDASDTGIQTSLGLFDDDNGLFFTVDLGTPKVVRRSNDTGSVVDDEVSQTNWNLDKMDGTGPSAVTIDFEKSNIFFIDYEWLGVGRVRMGFVVNGVAYPCHQFLNVNVRNGVYMSTPNLPLRYEIRNNGTGGATDIDQICSTVISEGGTNSKGILRYSSLEENEIDANTIGTVYVVFGIRLKTTALGATVKLISQSMINETSDDYEWLILLNPTLANAVTFSDETNSVVQTATGDTVNNPSNTTVTSEGTRIAGGYVKSSGNAGDITIGVTNAILLGSAIDGTRDEIYLCVRPLSSNADIRGGLVWRELG